MTGLASSQMRTDDRDRWELAGPLDQSLLTTRMYRFQQDVVFVVLAVPTSSKIRK